MPSNFNLNLLDDFQKNNSNYIAHDSKSSNASNGSLYSNYNSNDFKTKENENRRTSLIQNNMNKLNPIPKLYAKSHFSPQTSIRIKVIDELDGD